MELRDANESALALLTNCCELGERVELRDASESDLAVLANWGREWIEGMRAGNPMAAQRPKLRMVRWPPGDYEGVIFEERGMPVACAVFRSDKDGVYLRQFFVVRTQRRRGIGRAAMRMFRKRCAPRGVSLSLEVLTHNEGARAFWRALGMREQAIGFRAP